MIIRQKTIANILLLLCFCLLLFVLLPPLAWGQESQFDLAGHYSFLRAGPSGGAGSFNANGGSVSATWHATPWLGVAADFGGYNFGGQPQGVDGHLLTYTIGPRISSPREWGRWTPFGQLLLGGARVSGNLNGQSAGENGFALIAGGGADLRLNSHLALRVVQIDYLMTRFNRVNNTPGIQNDFRISTGVVLRFDRR